jgi:hypothetical protein
MILTGRRRTASKAFKPRTKQIETLQPILGKKMAESKGPLEGDRAHLARWLSEPRAEEVWLTIRKHAVDKHGVISANWFVAEVLSCRKVAQNLELVPQYLTHAKSAETLASFLRGQASLGPPMPNIPNCLSLAAALDEAARLLREQDVRSAKAGIVKNSRKSKTRPRIVFVQLLQEIMTAFCGKPLDYEVSVLTDIAFPESETSIEAVRSARRIKNPRKRTKSVHD